MPKARSGGENASPESLRSTRWYIGRVCCVGPSRSVIRSPSIAVLAKLVPDEAPHGNLLSDLGRDLVQQLPHRPGVVLHERLVEQDGLLVELLYLSLHHH